VSCVTVSLSRRGKILDFSGCCDGHVSRWRMTTFDRSINKKANKNNSVGPSFSTFMKI